MPARDGFQLKARRFGPLAPARPVVLISCAVATPQRFYRHFAAAIAAAGFTAITWDYRGVGESGPKNLRGFNATMRDWALRDMAGVIDWISDTLKPEQLFLVGHSAGGQLAGLLDNSSKVHGMVTVSAQSAYWRMQGGFQKIAVLFHSRVTMPLLTHLFGFLPWGRLLGGADVPKGAALEWARWSRNPKYLLGDQTLPLERFAEFTAPVLAYSIDDDNWGTAKSVDFMMSAYPNVERRHLVPADYGLNSIGHVGFFRRGSEPLWKEVADWLGSFRARNP